MRTLLALVLLALAFAPSAAATCHEGPDPPPGNPCRPTCTAYLGETAATVAACAAAVIEDDP